MARPTRRPHPRGRRLLGLLALPLLALLLSGCTRYPLWPIDPASPYASNLDRVWTIISYVAIGVALLVGGLMFYAVLRFGRRGRAPLDDDEPPQVHGNTRLELTWTLIPVLIVTVLLAVAVSTLQRNEPPAPTGSATLLRGALVVDIRGYQWGWAYAFPQLPGLNVPAGDLHLPVNRTIEWRVTSSDVVHDWWVPALASHMDAYPRHTERVVFVPTIANTYYAQCSKYCGLLHWRMHNNVVVESPTRFARWALANGARRAGLAKLLPGVAGVAALPAPGTRHHRT